MISLAEQIRCVEREIAMRKTVRWTAQARGKAPHPRTDHEIAVTCY